MLGSNGSGWALWKGGTIEYSIGIYKGALGEKTRMIYESELFPTDYLIVFSSGKLVGKFVNGYHVTAVCCIVIAKWVPRTWP